MRLPELGEKDGFVCSDCGHRFFALKPLLWFFLKCPKCGGHNIKRDTIIKW